MLPAWRKYSQIESMNCYHRVIQEKKGNVSGMLNVFTQLHLTSAVREALKLDPHSFGKFASSEPENPLTKASVSRRQAFSSATQSMSAELAMTSKMPHCGKPPLVSRSGESEALPQNQEGHGASAVEVPRSPKDCDGQILSRFKQRILVEPLQDNEEEKWEDKCRICYSSDASPNNPLLSPCLCSGSLLFIHLDCLKTWIKTKIQSGLSFDAIQKCDICTGKLSVDPNVFDLNRYVRNQQNDGIIGRFHFPDVLDIIFILGIVLWVSKFNSQLPWPMQWMLMFDA